MPTTDSFVPSSGTLTSSGTHRIKTWVRTPGYRTIPKANLPINAYTDYHARLRTSFWSGTSEYNSATGVSTNAYLPQYPCSLGQSEGYFSGTYSAWVADPAQNVASRLSSAENSVLVKVLGKASDAKVNVAVTLAEASKTSDMILDTARRIDRAYRALRRGNFREVARQLNISPNRVHNNWLAYKYGWTPLLMDVKNAAEFFAQQHVGRPIRFTVKSHQATNFVYNRSVNYVPYGGSTPNYATTEALTGHIVHRCKLWLEVTNPTASAVQQLGISNPLLIAWELVPYSFVFDWFCQVGNYLQGLTALQGLTVRKGMRSNLTEFEVSRSVPATTAVSGNVTYRNSAWNTGCTFRQYGRSSFSPNPLSIYPPKGTGLSFEKLVTGLALIRGSHRGSGNRI